MIDETRQFIRENSLISKEIKIVFAAVSGGIDSCVMLDILTHLQKDFDINLQILHVNHNTRGRDNLEDEKLVDELAKKNEIPIKIKKLSANSNKQSEVYLREQRYRFFNQILNNSKNAVIATAHNADDNVETVLMRMFRGSHLKGLTGIQPKRGLFIRPLLLHSRAAITAYASKNDIKYRDDRSNFDNTYIRNFFRNEIIPNIENKLKSDINQNILKTIEDLNQHYGLFADNLRIAIKESVKKNRQIVILNKNKYKKFSPLLRKGLLEYCISSVQPLNYGLSSKNFKMWDEFVHESTPGKKKNILDAGYAISERKEIIFGDFPKEKNESFVLKLNSEIVIDNKLKIEFKESDKAKTKFSENKNLEFIDGDKSGKQLVVRFWKKGDVFRPLGMKQKRKLSDFFIDLKLSARLKREIPIVCKNNQIIWIGGYRLDDQFKISAATKTVYKIAITKVENNA